MRKPIALLSVLVATLWLAACAGLLGPRDVTVPLAQMQAALSRKFPFNNPYLELLDVNIANPRLALQPGTNRLAITLDASMAPPFTNKTWQGNFTLTGGLQFDAARNAIMLADPRVESFSAQGLDPAFSRSIAKVGSILAEQVLKDTPLYTFRPQDLRIAGTSFFPSKINTTAGGVVVTFEPVR